MYHMPLSSDAIILQKKQTKNNEHEDLPVEQEELEGAVQVQADALKKKVVESAKAVAVLCQSVLKRKECPT